MIRHILQMLQYMLQDFQSISNHFWTLYIKGLKTPQNIFLIRLLFSQLLYNALERFALQKIIFAITSLN